MPAGIPAAFDSPARGAIRHGHDHSYIWEYMGYNSHLHALVADGLFMENGMFDVAPRLSTKPLEQLFRVRVIKMLVEEGLLAGEMARKLLSWTYSGFSVHNGKPIKRGDDEGLEPVTEEYIHEDFFEDLPVLITGN